MHEHDTKRLDYDTDVVENHTKLENRKIIKSALTASFTGALLVSGILTGLLPLVIASLAFTAISVGRSISGHFSKLDAGSKISESLEVSEIPEKLSHQLHHISEHPSKFCHWSLPHAAAPALSVLFGGLNVVVGALSLGLTGYLCYKTYNENKKICQKIEDYKDDLKSCQDSQVDQKTAEHLGKIVSHMKNKIMFKRIIAGYSMLSSVAICSLSVYSATVAFSSLAAGAAMSAAIISNPVFLGLFAVAMLTTFLAKSYIEYHLNVTDEQIALSEKELVLETLRHQEHSEYSHEDFGLPETVNLTLESSIDSSAATDEDRHLDAMVVDRICEIDESGYDADTDEPLKVEEVMDAYHQNSQDLEHNLSEDDMIKGEGEGDSEGEGVIDSKTDKSSQTESRRCSF